MKKTMGTIWNSEKTNAQHIAGIKSDIKDEIVLMRRMIVQIENRSESIPVIPDEKHNEIVRAFYEHVRKARAELEAAATYGYLNGVK